MSEPIFLVQGDTRPALVCNITDERTGDAINLTDTTVRLKIRRFGESEVTVVVVGQVVDPLKGQVVFYPQTVPEMLSGDAGDYEAEIEVTYRDNTVQTVYDTLRLSVREDF